MIDKQISYAVFKVDPGFFAIAGTDKHLLKTILPCPTKAAATKAILKEFNFARPAQGYMKSLQNDIKAYYKSTYTGNFAEIPVKINAKTDFARSVLKACRKIKPGQTVNYSQLAKMAGSPKAARAVGSVLAKNNLPLIIPCHRIIRNDGKLGGFTAPGGIKMKKTMLKHEKAL